MPAFFFSFLFSIETLRYSDEFSIRKPKRNISLSRSHDRIKSRRRQRRSFTISWDIRRHDKDITPIRMTFCLFLPYRKSWAAFFLVIQLNNDTSQQQQQSWKEEKKKVSSRELKVVSKRVQCCPLLLLSFGCWWIYGNHMGRSTYNAPSRDEGDGGMFRLVETAVTWVLYLSSSSDTFESIYL